MEIIEERKFNKNIDIEEEIINEEDKTHTEYDEEDDFVQTGSEKKDEEVMDLEKDQKIEENGSAEESRNEELDKTRLNN